MRNRLALAERRVLTKYLEDRAVGTSASSINRAPGIRAKSASLLKRLLKLGGAVPGLTGTMAVFIDPKGSCRRDTYMHFPSRLHMTIGDEVRAVPNPMLQLSHTVVGDPPARGTAITIEFLSPCPLGARPTTTQPPSGETLCNCMIGRSETALRPLPSSAIFIIFEFWVL